MQICTLSNTFAPFLMYCGWVVFIYRGDESTAVGFVAKKVYSELPESPRTWNFASVDHCQSIGARSVCLANSDQDSVCIVAVFAQEIRRHVQTCGELFESAVLDGYVVAVQRTIAVGAHKESTWNAGVEFAGYYSFDCVDLDNHGKFGISLREIEHCHLLNLMKIDNRLNPLGTEKNKNYYDIWTNVQLNVHIFTRE